MQARKTNEASQNHAPRNDNLRAGPNETKNNDKQ